MQVVGVHTKKIRVSDISEFQAKVYQLDGGRYSQNEPFQSPVVDVKMYKSETLTPLLAHQIKFFPSETRMIWVIFLSSSAKVKVSQRCKTVTKGDPPKVIRQQQVTNPDLLTKVTSKKNKLHVCLERQKLPSMSCQVCLLVGVLLRQFDTNPSLALRISIVNFNNQRYNYCSIFPWFCYFIFHILSLKSAFILYQKLMI